MKHNIFAILFFLCGFTTFAQLKDAMISVAVVPTMGNRVMVYKTEVNEAYKDSISKADRWRDALGASLMMSLKTSEKGRLFVGLQFHNFGFTRRKENIRFQDTIHPDIGVRFDLVQTGETYVDFNYRYQYLSIPFLFSWQLSGKKKKSLSLHALFGGSLSGRLKHDIRAVLYGFTMRGNKNEFILKDQGSEPAMFNANLHFALRVENLVYGKHTYIFAQPTFYMPLLVANYSAQRHQLYAIGVEVGLMFRLTKEKTE